MTHFKCLPHAILLEMASELIHYLNGGAGFPPSCVNFTVLAAY